MQAKIILCSALVFVWLSSVNAITVRPGHNITEGNCSGPLDYFLCNCTTLGTTIDIHLLSGRHYLMQQQSCFPKANDSIRIIGYSSNDTIIECKEPFNIVFVEVGSVTISNITMVNCGNVANDSLNQIVRNISYNGGHLGSGFRFAIMFYQVKNITITKFTMQNTLGYGILSFTGDGNITFYEVRIENTTFENEPQCTDYDYHNDTVDFACSGSGVFIVYYDNGDNKTNTLTIDQSHFIGNNNSLPNKQLGILNDIVNIGFSRASIPVLGSAGITIFYLQETYDVIASITNSNFCNNTGTLSASIAIGSFSTTRGKTFIQGCSFNNSNRISTFSDISSDNGFFSGGISYLSLIKRPGIHGKIPNHTDSSMGEILTVKQCNFTKLGGRLGAAFHIEKISVDATPLLINIEQCNFSENEANMGSAVYAVDRKLDATLSNYLNISLVNVNADNNKLLPGITVEFVSSTFITGLFHSENCHFKFNCSMRCDFLDNQPSVFYGSSAFVTISGKANFSNNTSLCGGGLNLLSTVAFVHEKSELYFGNNHAISNGGAIHVQFFNTNTQSRDRCPIQFIGSSNATYELDEIKNIDLTVTFENNIAGQLLKLQSIYANVFYVCSWYSNTLTQVYPGNNKKTSLRSSVYGEILSFKPDNSTNEHLSILAYLLCPCNENHTFDAENCLTADHNNTMQLGTKVIVGRSFTISLITLDAIGSVGHSSFLYSKVSSSSAALKFKLKLPSKQITRSFSVVNNACTPIDFTIYSSEEITYPANGTLHLSFPRGADHNLHFSFDYCPAGFSLQKTCVDSHELYACRCGGFFNKSLVKEDFQCDSVSGKIRRVDVQSWLSVINNNTVEYTRLCLPEHCNTSIDGEFNSTKPDVLCNFNHTGRACGKCKDGFSKVFGSKHCQECSNTWLLTILLYGFLGIILVVIIHVLKLTVTMGTINGLIFFCNIMSINESLFFNTSKFSFIRLFVSLINLDLGFEVCFYREMSEIIKTGLQFVFPLYLWLLMFIIIMVGKRYMRRGISTHSAVPVLATLILLSYSKLLRTTINVFTSVTVYHSETESDFNKQKQFLAWQPDPNVKYLNGPHIALFLIAVAFTVFFILPLAFALTFPSIVLRSKRLSYFFPLLDSVYAPYKMHCRSWFGMRIILLIYFSVMESILFSYQDTVLLSGVIVILLFVLMQAYIHPFKSTINNMLDLMFMVIFIALSTVILYLYPDTPGNKKLIAISIFGGVAFLLLCFIIIIHLHDMLMHFSQYSKFIETLQAKFHMKKSNKKWNLMRFISTENINHKPELRLNENINESSGNYAYLQESLLEEQFK